MNFSWLFYDFEFFEIVLTLIPFLQVLHVKHTLKNFGNLKFFRIAQIHHGWRRKYFDFTVASTCSKNDSYFFRLCSRTLTTSGPSKFWSLPSTLARRSRHAPTLCSARQTSPRNIWPSFPPERSVFLSYFYSNWTFWFKENIMAGLALGIWNCGCPFSVDGGTALGVPIALGTLLKSC